MPDGSIGLPVVAPVSRRLAWIDGGLWAGTLQDSLDQPPIEVFDQPTRLAAWSADGEALVFASAAELFLASGPDFGAVPLGIPEVSEVAWVEP